MASGSQLVVTTGNAFKGTINAAPGVDIYVQAGATFTPKDLFGFAGKFNNAGTATLSNSMGDGTQIINSNSLTVANGVNFTGNLNITNSACGTITFSGGLNFSTSVAALSNSGYILIGGTFTMQTGDQLANRGKMYVNGSYALNGKITNDGYLVLQGSTGANGLSGTDSLVNKNVVVIGGSATVDKAIRNDGLFWIGGAASFTANNNFIQTNSVSYLRVDGALQYADMITGTGVARVAGGKNGSGAGLFSLATASTVVDTTNFTPNGADMAKPCGIDNSPLPLPIVLQNFTAKAVGNAAQLNWSTVSELNGKAMVVQHSTDGVNFEDIATIASTGNNSLVQNYSYTDNNVASGVNYYRLKLVSSDAPTSYSAVVAVKFGTVADQQAISVFPNPFTDHFTVKFTDVKGGGNVVAKLYNAQGAVVLTQSFNSASSVTINTPASLATGVYVLEISANGEKYYHRLMKL